MRRKFWNWKVSDTGGRILRLDGFISDETWYGDEVTPKIFREELNSGSGNISVWINSGGGDVFAAAQIYDMLMEYKGNVTVKIDSIAASAASFIAMAGGIVEISPVGNIMIHNPTSIAIGDAREMKAAVEMLGEIKESIINAYELKTNLPREKLSRMMDAETWMNARKAVELGFADRIMFTGEGVEDSDGMIFSRKGVTNSLISKFRQTNFAENRIDARKLQRYHELLPH